MTVVDVASAALMVASVAQTWKVRGGRVARLNETECRIVGMIRDGLDTDMIAEELDVSRYMIRKRVRRISHKLTGDERGARMLELPGLADQAGACDEVAA